MLRFFSIAALLLSTTAAFSEQRLALVIGNDNYDNLPDLKKAVNDAKTMGDVFKELGFTVSSADTSPNSPFVRFLVEELRKPAAPLSKISNKVRLQMYNTGLNQQPWYQESSTSEIILHPQR